MQQHLQVMRMSAASRDLVRHYRFAAQQAADSVAQLTGATTQGIAFELIQRLLSEPENIVRRFFGENNASNCTLGSFHCLHYH
jgi:hypothetical protein